MTLAEAFLVGAAASLAVSAVRALVAFVLSRAARRERLVLTWLRPGALFGVEVASLTGIGRGALYPTLQGMEERGLIASRAVPGVGTSDGRPQRVYRLTDAGRAVSRG